MTLFRKYIPPVGKRVTLRLFSDYTQHLPTLAVWSHLIVRDVNGDVATVEHYNTKPTGELFTVPLNTIAPPVGWRPQYTIHVKPEQVEKVLGWFKRGIMVRLSHDLSGSMPTSYQPLDNPEQPHWQFPEVTDTVPAEDCPYVFNVVKVEQEDINFVHPEDCQYCHGTGRRTLQSIADVRNVPVESLNVAELRLDEFDGTTFRCSCRFGGFQSLGRSKRAKLVKQWKGEGWSTEYIPSAGGWWQRTREIVVHAALTRE